MVSGKWFIKKDEDVFGPVSTDDLQNLIKNGRITLDQEASQDETGPWKPLKSYGLFHEKPHPKDTTKTDTLSIKQQYLIGGTALGCVLVFVLCWYTFIGASLGKLASVFGDGIGCAILGLILSGLIGLWKPAKPYRAAIGMGTATLFLLAYSLKDLNTYPSIPECDRLAANTDDPERKAEGVEFDDIDADTAINACRQAVQLDSAPRLQYQYGRSLKKGKQVQEAVKWYKKAAQQGYAPAQSALGRMYNSMELARNETKGMGIFDSFRETVKNLKKNKPKAVEWYQKAAQQGYAPAQINLGNMYYNGEGVTENHSEAGKWYQKAAQQGYAPGQNNLGVIYENERYFQKAAELYRKSAEQGYSVAQYNMGRIYDKGIGVPKDSDKAIFWWKKAALQGNKDAISNLKRDEKGPWYICNCTNQNDNSSCVGTSGYLQDLPEQTTHWTEVSLFGRTKEFFCHPADY